MEMLVFRAAYLAGQAAGFLVVYATLALICAVALVMLLFGVMLGLWAWLGRERAAAVWRNVRAAVWASRLMLLGLAVAGWSGYLLTLADAELMPIEIMQVVKRGVNPDQFPSIFGSRLTALVVFVFGLAALVNGWRNFGAWWRSLQLAA